MLWLLPLLLGSPPSEGSLSLSREPDSTALHRLGDSLIAPWREQGHLLARSRIEAVGREARWSVTPGPLLVWRDLRTEGDSVFAPRIAQRLARLATGSVASPSSLALALERLRRHDCVELPSPARLEGSRGTTWADAWILVRSRPCSEAELAMGWDGKQQVQGAASLRLENLLGTARRLDFGASVQDSSRSFHAGWLEPWLGSWDLALRASAGLRDAPERQVADGSLEALREAPTGTWSLGLHGWSARFLEADSTRHRSSAWGTRAGWEWNGSTGTWLVPAGHASILLSTLRTRGTARPWLAQGTLQASAGIPAGALGLLLGIDAQALLPLDSLSSAGALRQLGGASDWKGHREGQFPTAQWFLALAELRAEAGGWGLALFAQPGAAWILRPGGAAPHPGLGYGGGLRWSRPAGEIRLDLAAGEDTRDWQELLLHLRLSNRF